MDSKRLKSLFKWLSIRKLTISLFLILFIGFTLTYSLGGRLTQFTEEILITRSDFRWEFISPGIQRCTITADQSNSVTLDVRLGFFYSDLGSGVDFQLVPGETQIKDFLLLTTIRKRTYSIYEIIFTFTSPLSQNFIPQKVTITITILTTTLETYLTNWYNTSTWEAPITLLFSLVLSIPISVIVFFWRKQEFIGIFLGSTCFFWALFLGIRFYTIQAYSLYTISLLPLIVSLEVSGLLLLLFSVFKGMKSIDSNW